MFDITHNSEIPLVCACHLGKSCVEVCMFALSRKIADDPKQCCLLGGNFRITVLNEIQVEHEYIPIRQYVEFNLMELLIPLGLRVKWKEDQNI